MEIRFLEFNDDQLRNILLNLKKKYNRTYSDLAREIGCHRTTVSSYMNGSDAGPSFHKKLLIYLNTNWAFDTGFLKEAIKLRCLNNVSKDDSNYRFIADIADQITDAFLENLVDISNLSDSDACMNECKKLLNRIKKK